MAAQSVASRSRPPHRPDTDDVVLARALEFSQWARNNIRYIVAGAIVALVVVGSLLYYRTYQADRLERAAADFMEIEATVSSGNVQLAVRDLESYIGRYEGTDYAAEARLLLARVRLQEGQPAEAIAALQGLARDPGDSPLAAQGALLLAAAQQAAGRTQEAIQTYLRVAEAARMNYQKVEALSSAALLRSLEGDHAGAAELYRRSIPLTEEGSLERSMFEMRLAEAEAQAGAR